jgi:hypothetical protein
MNGTGVLTSGVLYGVMRIYNVVSQRDLFLRKEAEQNHEPGNNKY